MAHAVEYIVKWIGVGVSTIAWHAISNGNIAVTTLPASVFTTCFIDSVHFDILYVLDIKRPISRVLLFSKK